MSEEITKFKVTIDGITVEVAPNTTIVQAARQIGGSAVPPTMCYYSKLENSGGRCRTCLVEVSKGSDKDPRPMPKLVPSCRTTIMDGMEVKVATSEKVKNAVTGITELLLLNHPLDCPICDQAGECKLQDLVYEHGLEKTRTEFPRQTFKKEDIGKYISLNKNRCILCNRCVLVANQLTNERNHGILFRGDHAEISTYISKAIENDFSGNMIDVCPVGALTDRTARFKSRVWFTEPVNARCNCDKCGGKVVLWLKGDEIIRITARKDEYNEVEEFICNECRFERKDLKYWTIEGPAHISDHSVISLNHYELPLPKNDPHYLVNQQKAKTIE
ncbi:MAG: (2Fe-2S)-binding protein [Flavobacteriaceae bacterium]|jgi:NADH-quinone oxidoreductase subunit G|nr:(2Fe-2S)-binding protein [Flavobacteriaceae bacterium]